MKNSQLLRITGTDYTQMTKQLLHAAQLADAVRAKAGCLPSPLIGIKPNLVSPTPAQFGATTHPEIVAGIIEYLQENHFDNIMICEGSWVGDKTADAFEYCGYNTLAEKYGVTLFDTQTDSSYTTHFRDMELHLCSCLKKINFLINVPVLKGHCQTKVTCALKNMKGLIPNSEKRRFHSLGLHTPIAFLNKCIHQDFIVIDNICGDPYFEDGGNPFVRNHILAAKDPVLADAYACQVLGIDPTDVPYIAIAREAGVGHIPEEFAVIEIPYNIKSQNDQVPNNGSGSWEVLTHASRKAYAADGLSQNDIHIPPACSDIMQEIPGTGSLTWTHAMETDFVESATVQGSKNPKNALRTIPLELNYATREIESCSACYSALTNALQELERNGRLKKLTDAHHYRFCIGQGYKNQTNMDATQIGIGSCTRNFAKNIPGCPPSSEKILEYLTALLQ